jgi:hypothetical protein
MYGLPTTTDLSFLVGKSVEQVCLGQYQTQVHLEHASISIECKHVLVTTDENRKILWERTGFPSHGISQLLGQTVLQALVIDEGILELSFSRGDRLLLFDDSDQYESFQINSGSQNIVV